MMTMTRTSESTAALTVLLLAFEIGERKWKLGFTTGMGQRPRIREIPAGALDRLEEEIARARVRLHVAPDAAVISCYEAGRIGFWLHRCLVAHGINNCVVDSASIEVNRRAKQLKTDRLDLGGLLNLLARYQLGDRRAWRLVRVPTVEAEDGRQPHRMRETLQRDRTQVMHRLKGLLASQGLHVPLREDFLARLENTRLWDGTLVPVGLKQRLTMAWRQLEFLNQELSTHDAARDAARVDPETATGRWVERLQTLRAIGVNGAWVLATEIFGWREIRNRRELAALVGVVPAPYQSGETEHDQGITRAGNTHVRRMMVQLAWTWLRYQPESALARWYHRRFGSGGKRMRRIGIVALARKLLIALWRYGEHGVIPEGAVLKPHPTMTI
jgi:transposase